MVKDDHRLVFKIASLALAAVTIAAASGFFMVPWLRQQDSPEPAKAGEARPSSDRLFRGWPKPDLALVLSGEQFGYMQPCGCSEPQKGGLARRYNFLKALRERGWPVAAADIGDIAKPSGPQAMLQYLFSMQALKQMDYVAASVGKNEFAHTLSKVLGEYALNEQWPRVLAANVTDKQGQSLEPAGLQKSVVKNVKGTTLRIGSVGIIGPSVAKAARNAPDTVVTPVNPELANVIKQLQPQSDLIVLLYQGTVDEAKKVAIDFPAVSLIACLSSEEEPSSRPDQAGNTIIVSVGQKGRYVGVVGVYPNANGNSPFQYRYQLAALDPEYETPQGKDATNPIHALMQKYAQEVKDGNYLAQYPQNLVHPMQISFPNATYVGSDKCKKCHNAAYQIWKDHPHSQAYETLVSKAKRPTLREYDGECVACHTTGFNYKTGFTDEKRTQHLKNVGCESCHGPASVHVDMQTTQPMNPINQKINALLNPLKGKEGEDPKLAARRIDTFCQRCHDIDNSVNFDFDKYWKDKKTIHN
jgi:hypothetical protein